MNSDEFVAESKEMLKTEAKPLPPVEKKSEPQKKHSRKKPRTFEELLALAEEDEDEDLLEESAFLNGYIPDYSRAPAYYYDW